MERQQMLNKLGEIRFAAFLTWLPTEMCIELKTMTPSGPGYSWIGEDDWNVYYIRPCKQNVWDNIRERIKTDKLTLTDLEGTDYGRLICGVFDDPNENNLSSVMKVLSGESFHEPREYYCYFDSDEGVLRFFSTKADLEMALADIYGSSDSGWDELDTEALEYWLDLYEQEGPELPFNYFEDEE